MLGDRPMVQWVYEAAHSCSAFQEVVVATDDPRIAQCVQRFGGNVEMTRTDHQTGTDRVAEVASRVPDYDVVVNVQGDQPFVTDKMLIQLVTPYLEGHWPHMTTLACPLNSETAYTDPHSVKVICNQLQHALYFSRSPIPYFRNPGQAPVYHHLGLYAFRQDFLAQYATLKPTPLETCEGLEQLRVLEHGYTIAVCQTEVAVPEINTPDDLQNSRSFIEQTLQQKVAS